MEEKKKRKLSKGTKTLLIIVCILVGLAILLSATVYILSKIGHAALTDDGSGMTMTAEETENTGTIRYKGKLYRYNDEISTVLLMGIDDYTKSAEATKFGEGNQSDVNVLAVMDPKNKKLTMIAVSRDAMCDLDVLNKDGEYAGTAHAQLALAYSYGDGAERSCELTRDAVSRIFYGLNIPAYGSIYFNGVGNIVDCIGGITITPGENSYGLTPGEPATLNGAETQGYIRYRAHTVEGNNERMDRQKQVMSALARAAIAKAKENPTSILDIYRSAQKDVTTNLNASMIVYLAQLATKLNFDGEIYKVPGESVLGAQDHAEFIVDEDALYEMILDIFYIEVAE